MQDNFHVSTEGLLERGVVSTLWQSLETLLSRGSLGVQHAVRLMQECLPSIDCLELQELPALAQLHMSSASNLMKTLRLMVPDVFVDASDSPNHVLFLKLQGDQLDVVAVLVELQLFHMLRAADLVAAARKQLHTRASMPQPAAETVSDQSVTSDEV